MKFNRKILIACIVIAILIPLYFHIQFLLSGEQKALEYRGVGVVYAFIVSVLIFIVNLKTLDFLRRKYPWNKKPVKGLILKTLLTNLNASIIISILALLFNFVIPDFHDKKLSIILFNNIVIAIIINTIAFSFIEGFYFFKQWKISLIQTEQLKRENIQSQLEALKNQIDPHFLFNSLNTMYSLIDPSPDKAKDYITKFSKIYRYVLNVKDKIVVQLSEEIDFVNSYYFLQKIRHEGNLTITVNVDAVKLNDFIPPLSLQTLVENAIKHNIISEKMPLKISITNNNDFVIVKNNLQIKESMNESTKIGLKNLTLRYEHVSEIAPKFYILLDENIAEIPLLKDE